MKAVVLDSGALIALERQDHRMIKIVDRVISGQLPTYLPAGVLAQVWRGSPRQHSLTRLVRDRSVRVEPLSEDAARSIGRLLAASGTSDVVDGHVALLARHRHATVITSDPKDLQLLDATLPLIIV